MYIKDIGVSSKNVSSMISNKIYVNRLQLGFSVKVNFLPAALVFNKVIIVITAFACVLIMCACVYVYKWQPLSYIAKIHTS